jgi:hypothetical protein
LLESPQDEAVNPRVDVYMFDLATLKFMKKFRKVPPVYGWVAAR